VIFIKFYYYYYYKKLYCWKNIENVPENYHQKFTEIFQKSMKFSGEISRPTSLPARPPNTTGVHKEIKTNVHDTLYDIYNEIRKYMHKK